MILKAMDNDFITRGEWTELPAANDGLDIAFNKQLLRAVLGR